MKKCLYCHSQIDPEDNFEKIGRKYVCVLCSDDDADALESYASIDEELGEDGYCHGASDYNL